MSLPLVTYLEGIVNIDQLKIEPTEFRKRLYLKTLNAFFLYKTELVKIIKKKVVIFCYKLNFNLIKTKVQITAPIE